MKDDTMMLTPNGTADRLRYIAKIYGSRPMLVIDMIDVVARTVGDDNWTQAIREAAKVDANFNHDAQQYGIRSWPGLWRPDGIRPPAEYVNTLVAMVSGMPAFSRATPADPLFPWMATQLVRAAKAAEKLPATSSARADADDYVALLDDFRSKGTLLAQWFVGTRPDLTKLDAATALDEASEWAEERDDEEKVQKAQGEIVHTFKDGFTVQKLKTAEQLNIEGDVMQHCVGGYADEVNRDRTIIYSIRDPKGHPHVTIEFDPHHRYVKQIKGKQNAEPAPKYKPYVEEFTATLPSLPAALQAIVDVVKKQPDIDEDVEVDLAREWMEEGFDAEEVASWYDIGISTPSEAARLSGEDVTPAELTTWPEPVRRKLWDISGLSYKDLEWLVMLARMVTKLTELEQRRPPPPPQMSFGFTAPERKRRPKTRGDWRDQRSNWDNNDRGFDLDEWLDQVDAAEAWQVAGFAPADVEPWYMAYFPPKEAARWNDDIGVGVEVAIELRKRGVSAAQVEEAVHDGRLLDSDVDQRLRGTPYSPREIASKILRGLGLEQNRRRVR